MVTITIMAATSITIATMTEESPPPFGAAGHLSTHGQCLQNVSQQYPRFQR